MNPTMPKARKVRGDTLFALSHGILTPAVVVQMAARTPDDPRRDIPLTRLLEAVPGWDGRSAQNAVALVCAVCDCRASEHDHTVSWLLKPKADGWRVLAFADATRRPPGTGADEARDTDAPWPGFPFTPRPKAAA